MSEPEKEKPVALSAAAAWVDAVLKLEMPLLPFTESMYKAMAPIGEPVPKPEPLVQAERRRAELMALPEPELREMHARLLREQQEAEARRLAAVEARTS